MSRRRKITWLVVLLVLTGGIGGFCWYWHSTAVDRKIRGLAYESADYPYTKTEKLLKKCELDFLLREKPKPRDWKLIKEELLSIGHAAIPELISLINDKDEIVEVRRSAVGLLCCIRNEQAFKAMIDALRNSENPIVRTRAAQNLGIIGDKRAVDPLIEGLLKDSDENVRDWAADALAVLGDRRAIEPLKQARSNHLIDYGVFRGAIEKINHCPWKEVHPDDKGGEP